MPILFKTELLHQDIFVWQIVETQQELQLMIPTIPVPDFTHEKRRLNWLGTRCLIQDIFKNNPEIEYNEHGKPFLSNGEIISISHSGNLIAVARSKFNCGIDIQKFTPKVSRILPKFLNDSELHWLNNKNDKTSFHHLIWCAKEAIFKVFGVQVDFQDDITIHDFNLFKQGRFEATVLREKIKKTFQLQYQLLGDYFLVFTHE